MPRSQRPGWLPVTFALAGALSGAALFTLIAYRFSPFVALGLPLSVAAVSVIFARPTLGIYLAVLAAPLESFNLSSGGVANLSPPQILLILTGASAAAHMLLSRRRRNFGAPHVAFAALIAVAATGIVFAPESFTVAKFVVMWSVFLALSVWITTAERHELRALLPVIAVSGGILGLVAVLHGGSQELVGGGTRAINRAEAGFTSPNTLGAYLVMTLPVALVLSLRGPSALRLPMLGAAGLTFAGVVLSLSREAFIGAAVTLAVLLLWAEFRRLFTGLLVVLALFTAFNLNPLLHSQQFTVVQQRLGTIGSSQEKSTNPRIRIWRTTPSIIADHFVLGVGEGNYQLVAPQYGLYDVDGSVIPHAHDILLTVGAEMGLVGLAVFVWFLGTVVRAARAALRPRRTPEFPLVLGVVASLAGLFALGVFDYVLRTDVVMALVMLEVGVLAGYARLAREDSGGRAQATGGAAPGAQPAIVALTK